jgi:hypothetical protein
MKKATGTGLALLVLTLSALPAPAQGQKPNNAAPAAPAVAPANTPAKADVGAADEIAEKLAYKKAADARDPKQRAAAFEAFIEKYPQSLGKISALQQAVAAYSEAGDRDKVEQAGERLLALDPQNVRVMALVALQKRNRAYQGQDVQTLARQVGELGERGLKALADWARPNGIDDAQFARLRAELTTIFTDAVAYGAFQAHDYKAAHDNYLKTFAQHPDSFFDTYYLGVASLEMTPLDPNGFWYVAKALNIAQTLKNPAAVATILAYGKGKYENFKGNDDGWDQIVAASAKQNQPPSNFLAAAGKK